MKTKKISGFNKLSSCRTKKCQNGAGGVRDFFNQKLWNRSIELERKIKRRETKLKKSYNALLHSLTDFQLHVNKNVIDPLLALFSHIKTNTNLIGQSESSYNEKVKNIQKNRDLVNKNMRSQNVIDKLVKIRKRERDYNNIKNKFDNAVTEFENEHSELKSIYNRAVVKFQKEGKIKAGGGVGTYIDNKLLSRNLEKSIDEDKESSKIGKELTKTQNRIEKYRARNYINMMSVFQRYGLNVYQNSYEGLEDLDGIRKETMDAHIEKLNGSIEYINEELTGFNTLIGGYGIKDYTDAEADHIAKLIEMRHKHITELISLQSDSINTLVNLDLGHYDNDSKPIPGEESDIYPSYVEQIIQLFGENDFYPLYTMTNSNTYPEIKTAVEAVEQKTKLLFNDVYPTNDNQDFDGVPCKLNSLCYKAMIDDQDLAILNPADIPKMITFFENKINPLNTQKSRIANTGQKYHLTLHINMLESNLYDFMLKNTYYVYGIDEGRADIMGSDMFDRNEPSLADHVLSPRALMNVTDVMYNSTTNKPL